MIQIGSAVPSKERVVLSADGSLSGIFLIVVRSRSASEPQTGELWIDGKLHSARVVFTSGEGVPMERLSTDEKVMGIRPPLGPSGHIAYLITLDDLKILRRSAGNQTSLSPPSTQSVLAVYATNGKSVTGPLRVYRNDTAQDSDGDGLGNELES
jgi:hypothetical protein